MLEFRNILNKKLNKKGFALAELLVVVAIIAILVAVSIPIFTGKLEEAKKSTDMANERAAKAAAVTAYLTDETQTSGYYNAEDGVIVNTFEQAKNDDGKGYNKSKENGASTDAYVVYVKITPGAEGVNPTVNVEWVSASK